MMESEHWVDEDFFMKDLLLIFSSASKLSGSPPPVVGLTRQFPVHIKYPVKWQCNTTSVEWANTWLWLVISRSLKYNIRRRHYSVLVMFPNSLAIKSTLFRNSRLS
uniref:Uncharacterized protein n=1 Tax=Cacopsylla melanoneura TaxID=428564 RepID=A0A8D8W4W1_9HEMI